MIKRVSKKGLSPVIATVLLIGISLAIALIIFFWARALIGEKTLKFGNPVEDSCANVEFTAEVFSDGEVAIENNGNIAIYGAEIRKKDSGTIAGVGKFTKTISYGETGSGDIGASLDVEDEVIVVPLILGEAGDYKKAYTCDEEHGYETSVEV